MRSVVIQQNGNKLHNQRNIVCVLVWHACVCWCMCVGVIGRELGRSILLNLEGNLVFQSVEEKDESMEEGEMDDLSG